MTALTVIEGNPSAERGGQSDFRPVVVDESFAASQLPVHDIHISDWTDLAIHERPTAGIGRICTSLIELSDGSRNIYREIEPEQQRYELPLHFGTPLGTRVKGYNTYMGIQAAKLGIRVGIVGAPQVMPDDDVQLQSHEASVFAHIVRAAHEAYDDGEAATAISGYSWSGMRAPASIRYLQDLGVHVPFAVTIDACLPEEMSLSDTRRDMTIPYVHSELRALRKGLLRKESGESWLRVAARLGHMAGTVGMSPRYALTHAHITRELWRGEAGTFIPFIPEDTAFIAHFNEHSPFNQRDRYAASIQQLPNGRVVTEPGVHLSSADSRIVKAFAAQIAFGQDLYELGADANQLADSLARPLTPTD